VQWAGLVRSSGPDSSLDHQNVIIAIVITTSSVIIAIVIAIVVKATFAQGRLYARR